MAEEIIDKRKDISEYIFVSKYARTINGRKETWDEAVDRVMSMHLNTLKSKVDLPKEFTPLFMEAYSAYKKKEILGAQRALQFGGDQLLHHNTRMYNCASSYLNRVDFFKEAMYLLLSGAGIGYSVQKHHINQLPKLQGVNYSKTVVFKLEDSIEGWAESAHQLISSYYNGSPQVKFDFSNIRPKGSFISGGFKAPGPEPLSLALEKIRKVLDSVKVKRRLTSFELHYIMCILADSVISGGVRRSAMICLFDADDKDMLECKLGNWFETHPELCRSNNSVVILPNTPKEQYDYAVKCAKQFGEPGLAFLKNKDFSYNPCFEVGMFPQYENEDGTIEYGWSFCNLVTVNGGRVNTVEDFYRLVRAAAILGTIQACYTNFDKVLSPTTKKIVDRDALIGIGLSGMCSNPEIIFNEEYQREAAKIVVETNKVVSKMIGINPAARTTCVKPDGNSSQLLGGSSGVGAYHFRRYIRNIQAADVEQAVNEVIKINPDAVERSVYNRDREYVISYPVTIDDKSLVRSDLTTLQMLDLVKKTQQNWVEYGTNFDHPSYKRNPELRMNVSNTITVRDGEWDIVRDYLWENKEYFCGVSFLPESGDLDYPQAPYTSYLDEKELVETYGKGAILSSGLIVDGLNIFNDIWQACSAAIGNADNLLEFRDKDVADFIEKNINDGKFLIMVDGVGVSDVNAVIQYLKGKVDLRVDWVRRFNKFSENYFNGDKEKTARCLKHVNIFHKWHKISKMKPIDWDNILWNDVYQEAGEQIGTACAGGKCEI